ncbi:MAG: glycosyl transferase [Candidatus Amulumruptor sp.]
MAIKTLLWTYIVKPIRNLGNDKGKIKRQWKQIMGYDLDLTNPRTFNEKIQYLKLLERKPEYTVMADKYAAKKWIADRVGEQYVPKRLGVWKRAEDIDFDILPDRFVLKTTHDSGGVIIVKDKADLDKGNALDKHNLAFDRNGVIKFLNEHLKANHYNLFREWVYKNITPQIIAEEFLDPNKNTERSPDDFRLFCFNGEPRIAYIDKTWFDSRHVTHYSLPDWEKLPIVKKDCTVDEIAEPRPENLDEMIEVAKKLSKGLPFLRVDFFLSNGKIYVGEVTFFPVGGYEEFETPDTQQMMGDMIDLSPWREYGGGIYLQIKKLRSILGLKGL